MEKIEVARRQLGTALGLYLQDLDPVSVHSLASAACELLQHLSVKAGKKPFNHYMKMSFPGYSDSDLRRAQHEFWNAFKHALRPDQRTERNDDPLLSRFSDEDNDHMLFVAWFDYANVADKLPIEAQVFQIWYLCLYLEDGGIHLPPGMIDEFFPNLPDYPREVQKQELRKTIEAHRALVGDDPLTEPMPLILPRLAQI